MACKPSPLLAINSHKTNRLNRFLWVTFQIQELCSQHCDDDIRRAIGNLPKGLTQTFNRALDRIISLEKTSIARDVFVWAIAGRRPLTLEEFREVVGIEIGQPSSRPERHVNGIHRLTAWCANLVEVDEEEKTVHLVHHCVLKFLLHQASEPRFTQFHFDMDVADHYAGEICVTYLNFSDLSNTIAHRPQTRSAPPITPKEIASTALGYRWGSLPSRAIAAAVMPAPKAQTGSSKAFDLVSSLQRPNDAAAREKLEQGYPFLSYAKIHWLWHARSFKKRKTRMWTTWREFVVGDHHLTQVPWSRGPISMHNFETKECDPSHFIERMDWACDERHYGVIRALYDERDGKRIPGASDSRLLKSALGTLDAKLLELCDYYICEGSPTLDSGLVRGFTLDGGLLSFAALLRGSSYDCKDKGLGNVLCGASAYGCQEAVELLLVKGVCPNTAKAHWDPLELYSPLHLSVLERHAGVTEALLSAGADLDFTAPRKPGLTDLEYALTCGHSEIATRHRRGRNLGAHGL